MKPAKLSAAASHRGTEGSNPFPPAAESVSAGSRGRCRSKSRRWRRLGLVWDVRKGRAGYDQTYFGSVSLTGIDAVPLQQSSTPVAKTRRAAVRPRPAAYLLVVRLS